jgi:hypothetical protein
MPQKIIPLTKSQHLLIVLTCLSLIIVFYLFPFDFSCFYSEGYICDYNKYSIFDLSYHLPNVLETSTNFILFFLLSANLKHFVDSKQKKNQLLSSIFLFTLPLILELTQLWLPSRNFNLSDIIFSWAATISVYYLSKNNSLIKYLPIRIIESLSKCIRIISFQKSLSIYTALAILLIFKFSIPGDLSIWNPNYYLIVGNEKSGDRPWHGLVNFLSISSESFSQQKVNSLLTDTLYPLNHDSAVWVDQLNLREKTLASPESYSQLCDSSKEVSNNVTCSFTGITTPHKWYESETPISTVINQIRQTNEFAINILLTSLEIQQTGPARIISVSADPYHRNITLGQDGADLIFRLRTVVTGFNGARPQYRIPNVFKDTLDHKIIVSYASPLLRIYIDEVENVYTINIPIQSYYLTIFFLLTIPYLFIVLFKE